MSNDVILENTGKVVTVDSEDYEAVSEHTWYELTDDFHDVRFILWPSSDPTGDAFRIFHVNGQRMGQWLEDFIFDVKHGRPFAASASNPYSVLYAHRTTADRVRELLGRCWALLTWRR